MLLLVVASSVNRIDFISFFSYLAELLATTEFHSLFVCVCERKGRCVGHTQVNILVSEV